MKVPRFRHLVGRPKASIAWGIESVENELQACRHVFLTWDSVEKEADGTWDAKLSPVKCGRAGFLDVLCDRVAVFL